MYSSIESRLWLAVHLLYPNSSQAFDIYQAIVMQTESAISKGNRELVYSKLVMAFDKITAINSNLSFYEFESEQIDQWKIIYKSSQKIQLIIFVGVLIFELKITDISRYVRLSDDKTQFLFHQMFKKLVQNSSKVKYGDQLDFKKQNDMKISYLYTYENLIEFCLGQLSDTEAGKVRIGLELYPILQTTRDEYQKVIGQIQSLKVQRGSTDLSRIKSKFKVVSSKGEVSSDIQSSSNNAKLNQSVLVYSKNKRLMAGLLTGFVLALVFLSKNDGIYDLIGGNDHSIVLQKIPKKSSSTDKPPEIALESLPQPNETHVDLEGVNKVSTPEPIIANNENIKANENKISDDKSQSKTNAQAKGGLYRGSLFVKNLKITNKEILKTLVAFGAKKAGEVELGWLKSNNTAYYHFTLPEAKIEEARTFLQKIGKLEIRFENHPRMIPAGNKRFIIEIKE